MSDKKVYKWCPTCNSIFYITFKAKDCPNCPKERNKMIGRLKPLQAKL